MGHGGIGVVSDAGPIVHLAEIDGLDLVSIFEQVHLSDAVWRETVAQGRVPRQALLNLGNIRRHSLTQMAVQQFTEQHRLEALHAGERECLCLCHDLGIPILLTDDLAARAAARRLDLTPVGSLGIVVRACLVALISQSAAERYLTQLHEVSSLFVTPAIVESMSLS